MKKILITVLITLFIISGMWILSSQDKEIPAVNVYTVSPEKKNIYDYINADGRIKEGNRRDIYVKQLSEIGKVFVTEGETVKKGSPLFEIKPLFEKEISENTYSVDNSAVFDVFREYGFEIPDIEAFSFISTEESLVTSPIDGVITDVNVFAGENVNAIKKLITVSDFSDVYISVLIPEAYSARVAEGSEAKITAEAFGDNYYSGKIESISPVAKYVPSLTGEGKTYISAVVRPNNKNKLFRPELTVKTKITVNTIKDALTIPYECIRQDDVGREFVYCVENGVLKKQMIKTGYELDKETEIQSGLKKDSVVVLNPDDDLNEGMRVVCMSGSEFNLEKNK